MEAAVLPNGVPRTQHMAGGAVASIPTESLSARKGSEKSVGLQPDHRGIQQARSSEGGIGGAECAAESIQVCEPVDSNPVTVGRASLEQLEAKDVDPAPSISRVRWLNSLKRGDTVLVRNHVHEHFPAQITNATPCYLFTSKLKFHRLTGAQTNRQRRKVYRMRLILVRDEKEKLA